MTIHQPGDVGGKMGKQGGGVAQNVIVTTCYKLKQTFNQPTLLKLHKPLAAISKMCYHIDTGKPGQGNLQYSGGVALDNTTDTERGPP